MHNQRLLTHILGAASVVGLLSSQAAAELCYNGISISPGGTLVNTRVFPSSISGDTLNISCAAQNNTFTTGKGRAFQVGGNRFIEVDKTGGLAGTRVGVEGLTLGGLVVCDAGDSTNNQGVPVPVSCPPTAVRFRVSASF
jgi:hypothetical protein